MWKAVPSMPLETVWKSMPKSAFGRKSPSNSSPACRDGALKPFTSPGHWRFMSIRSTPRPEFGQRRAMPSRAGREMS